MTIRMQLLRVLPLAGAAFVTTILAAGCVPSGSYSPSVYGSVGVGSGYYGGYGRAYYSPWYGRPYPPYGVRPPGMRPPISGPPRPTNPIERRPSPGRMPSMMGRPSMGGPSRMPSIPSMPRPAMRR